ncbi:MAG: hypothetical protein MRY74_15755 [Neomegalonema sp.]|nr:hypothetical protein [Neomegalonema sp.]
MKWRYYLFLIIAIICFGVYFYVNKKYAGDKQAVEATVLAEVEKKAGAAVACKKEGAEIKCDPAGGRARSFTVAESETLTKAIQAGEAELSRAQQFELIGLAGSICGILSFVVQMFIWAGAAFRRRDG